MSLKATELRLNNQIEVLTIEGSYLKVKVNTFFLEQIEDHPEIYRGISISEAALRGFGFLSIDDETWMHSGVKLEHDGKAWFIRVGTFSIKVENIHELQNKWFYLIGEEL